MWQPLCGEDASLHEFLRSNEWQHLHLSSLFVTQEYESAKRQQRFLAPSEQVKRVLVYQRDQIQAMLVWTKHKRLLFDCLALRNGGALRDGKVLRNGGSSRNGGSPGHALRDGESYPELPYLLIHELKKLLRRHPAQQFIGTKQHYDFLQRHCDLQLEGRLYLMMVRRSIVPEVPKVAKMLGHLERDLRLERLDFSYYQQLLPLELAYYEEEVLLAPASPEMQNVLKRECARRLKKYLQYGIFVDKQLIARIMINAYGLYYWQIGGLYTAPHWRGRGLGKYLLRKMCRVIEDSGRTAMLFVREGNAVAQALYAQTGFEVLDHMVIAQNNL